MFAEEVICLLVMSGEGESCVVAQMAVGVAIRASMPKLYTSK